MAKPRRIQLKRTKGYRKPKEAVTVTRATRWGNPWLVKDWGQHKAVALFREDLFEREVFEGPKGPVTLAEVRAALKGRDLACYCEPGQPCHADVLIKAANSTGSLKTVRRVTGGMGIGEQPGRLGRKQGGAPCDHMGDPLPTRWDYVLDRGVR